MIKKNIMFILGTSREGRLSEHVARFVFSCAKERDDFTPLFVDVRDYVQTSTEGLEEEKLIVLRKMITEAAGFVIISPEYNHGYPGELKMFLDNAYKEYEGKPFAICGVSDGPVGGARMAENLKPVLSAFQAIIINAAVYFAFVKELFDEAGNIKEPEMWKRKVSGMLDQVIKYTNHI
jgi:NAD(P)H-dependent FMN reductase